MAEESKQNRSRITIRGVLINAVIAAACTAFAWHWVVARGNDDHWRFHDETNTKLADGSDIQISGPNSYTVNSADRTKTCTFESDGGIVCDAIIRNVDGTYIPNIPGTLPTAEELKKACSFSSLAITFSPRAMADSPVVKQHIKDAKAYSTSYCVEMIAEHELEPIV